MGALSLMQMIRFSPGEQNVSSVAWICVSEGSRQDSLGSPIAAGGKTKASTKSLIIVISVISKEPEVKLFLAPWFKPLLFIF